jgi:hypothetical protein
MMLSLNILMHAVARAFKKLQSGGYQFLKRNYQELWKEGVSLYSKYNIMRGEEDESFGSNRNSPPFILSKVPYV